MSRICTIFCFLCASLFWGISLPAQTSLKHSPPADPNPTGFEIQHFDPAVNLATGVPRAARALPGRLAFGSLPALPAPGAGERLRVTARAENGLPLYIEGQLAAADRQAPLAEQARVFLAAAAPLLGIKDPVAELIPGREAADELGFTHLRVRQEYQGLPVYGGELLLHARGGEVFRLNGRTFPTPDLPDISPALDGATARAIALTDLTRRTTVRQLTEAERAIAHHPEAAPELIVYHHGLDLQSERLVWHLRLVPNVIEHWEYFVDAHTGEILNQWRATCTLRPTGLPAPPPGPTTAQAQDLKGFTRTINVYEEGGAYFLIDASRPMYDPVQSDMPGDPAGVVWTIDAQGSNPFSGSLNAIQVFSSNNTWSDPVAVSAHYNAGQAYEYFRSRFGRNSINGSGGNVVSVINVNEESGEDMDNAFWNGFAMFYGNGNTFFSQPLARSLDVAGHEMSHGVIQNTANLIYQGQSGALNESFADVFGVLIDPANYQLGEDVVNSAFYATGALRDMADPNNGGSSLSDPGWQPAHMDEFQNLSLNQNNGGVHVNSGIPNRAFYLFASAVGNAKAEQVYYRALDSYLTASSQFIDCRLAVIQAAADLYGAGSAEANAAADAFSAVGIGQGSGSGGQDDLETNEGQDYIIATDGSLSALYLFDWTAVDAISDAGVRSRPSVTDDGRIIVFVAADNTLRALILNEQTSLYEEIFIENNPQQIWRNIAISKDGTKIAMLTTDYDNIIEVYDFVSATGATFELRNPTTAPGGVIYTDDVAYADVLEWDYSGEFLLYDALTQLAPSAGGTEFWDIGMVQVWDNGAQAFADGFTFKLFSSLPAGSSVGNPTFAKNSPYVIAFDFIGDTEQLTEVTILGANVETGDIGEIHYNGDVLGVPNYSVDDDRLIFNNYDSFDGPTVDLIDLAGDKISSTATPLTLLEGGQFGIWFATGERELVSIADLSGNAFDLHAQPNPFGESLQLVFRSERAGHGQLQLYDQLGRVVYEQTVRIAAGGNNVPVAPSGLAPGVYAARLWTPEGQATVRLVRR